MDILHDVRFAVRGLRRTPGFTVAAVASLALGIGVNTTVFSLVNAISFRPLPYRDADRLVALHEESATELCHGCTVGTSHPGYADWTRETSSFEQLGAYLEERFTISSPGDAEPVGGCFVSANLFPILGVAPVLGRGFRAEDDRPAADRVLLISDELWRRRFGADPAVLGRPVKVNGEFYTLIGVMPARFRFPEFAHVWIPLAPRGVEWPRADRQLGVIARLKHGVTPEQASTEMRQIAARLADAYPGTNRNWSASVVSLRDDVASDVAFIFWTLLGAVAFVLLIACANLASLLLVRATTRYRELAIRVAVGASRARLIRQLLIESVMLASAGGVLGLGISIWGTDLAVAAIGTEVPFWITFGIDWRVLLFCAGASLFTAIGFGLVPALQASRPDVERALREEGIGGGASRRSTRLRSVFVAAEIAMALLLLVGAGLMIKTFLRFSHDDPGYDMSRLLTANVDLQGRRYDEPRQIAKFTSEAIERLNRVPGLDAAFARTGFVAGFGAREIGVSVDGLQTVPGGASPRFYFAITPRYFQTLGIPMLRGRAFSDRDADGAAPVAIVNEEMARQIWPDRDPLGARIKLGPRDSNLPWLTVVGVVRNTAQSAVRRGQSFSFAYVPLAQAPGRTLTLTVRTPGEPMRMAATVATVMRDVDPDEAVQRLMSVGQSRAREIAPQRFMAVLMSSVALLGLLIAAVGIYAVVAYAVEQRTREIGIRIALGATRRDVMRLVLAGGARLGAGGVAAGVLAALTLTRVLQGMLFGTSPTDPVVFALVSIVLGSITIVATYVPARRAAGTDPWRTLSGKV